VEPDKIFGGLTTEADNINRSKDNAIAPPPFGSPGSYMAGTGNPLAPGLYGDISAAGANSGSGAVYVSADSGNVLPPGRFVFSGVISERSRGFANWR
jgi:sortase A